MSTQSFSLHAGSLHWDIVQSALVRLVGALNGFQQAGSSWVESCALQDRIGEVSRDRLGDRAVVGALQRVAARQQEIDLVIVNQ